MSTIRDAVFETWIAEARALPIEAGLLGRSVAWKNGGRGTERCGPCPACGGDDRFSINIAKGVWNCRGACGGRDPISLAIHVAGVGFLEAVELLVGNRPETGATFARFAATAEPLTHDLAKRRAALTAWAEARDSRGTPVERYLNGRGLVLADDLAGRVLRFHPRCPWEGRTSPAMVALYRDILTDEPVAIHRTALTADGQKIGRKMLGSVRGAAIKLDADAHVTIGLVIGEGIETCLAARQLGFRPVWAPGSVGAISSFPVLPGVDGLTILAEAGEPSAKAVQACGTRWSQAEGEVIVVSPRTGSDINDAFQGQVA
jgi:hypothetical protein